MAILTFLSLLAFFFSVSPRLVSSQSSCYDTETLTLRPQVANNDRGLEDYFDSLEERIDSLPLFTDSFYCSNVTINPGVYVITREHSISDISVSLRGIGRVVVVFNRGPSGSGGDRISALDFERAGYIEIIGMDFDGGFGFIEFQNINEVIIKDSRFRRFQEGALDLNDCQSITLTDSTFNNNGNELIQRIENLQGGSGGLSIQYTNDLHEKPWLYISNVTFAFNTAGLNANITSTGFTEVTSGESFTGRGGAIFLLLNNEVPLLGIIDSCRFRRNLAALYGGAIYVAFDYLSNHDLYITNSNFSGNSAELAGGAVMTSYLVGGDDDHVNSVNMTGCRLDRNFARYGGAVYFFVSITAAEEDGELGTFAAFVSCNFTRNGAQFYGSAIGATALNLFDSKGETKPAEITDCLFEDNESLEGATIGINNFPFEFKGNNTIIRNKGPGIIVIGVLVTMSGNILFISNDIKNESTGALLFLSNGQIRLMRNTNVSFIDNRGGYGAGIVPTISFTPSSFSKLSSNPLCSFLYEDSSVPPDQWEVNMYFNGNRAIIGSAVYVNSLNRCSWVGGANFNLTRAYRWNFMTFGPNNINDAHAGRDENSFDVQTQPVRTVVTTPTVGGFPGQRISLDISSFGETGTLTYAIWRFQQFGESSFIVFDPSTVPSRNNLLRSIDITYYLTKPSFDNNINDIVRVQASTVLNEEESMASFNLRVRTCPAGSVLTNIAGTSYYGCYCNMERTEIRDCEDKIVYISYYRWASISDKGKDKLFLIDCPPGYCQCTISQTIVTTTSTTAATNGGTGGPNDQFITCDYVFNMDNSSSICSCDRRGVLCGECVNSSSVSVLLNKCTSCSNANSILIPLLILADVMIFLVILILARAIPDWYLTSLYYLQIISIVGLRFPETFERVHPYLYYVVSLLSFYYPYDFCIYSNMSTSVSYVLKFIPLFCASIMIPIVMFIRDCLLKRRVKRRPHHGAIDIIQAIYTPSLYAALSILNCPSVPITNGNNVTGNELRWFHDGTVKCFSGGHIGLTVLALIATLYLLITIPSFFIMSFDKSDKIHRCFHFAAQSVNAQFKEKYFYWGAIILFKKMIIVVLLVAIPSKLSILLLVITLFTGVQTIFQPYKTFLGNLTHTVMGCLVFLLLALTQVDKFLDDNHYSSYKTVQSLSDETDSKCNVELQTTSLVQVLAFFYYLPLFFALIIYIGFFANKIYKKYKEHRKEKRKLKEAREMMSVLKRIPSTTGNVDKRREQVTSTLVRRSELDNTAPISPSKLEESVEIDWKPARTQRNRLSFFRNRKEKETKL